MKRFTFELDSVRSLRAQEEQIVQVELAGAMAERNVVQAELDASRKAEADLYIYVRENNLGAHEMRHVASYGALHRQKIFDQGVKLRQFEKGIELIRVRLVEARAKREALDRLREKQLKAHRAETLREEQRDLDDLVAMRHGHASAGAMSAEAA